MEIPNLKNLPLNYNPPNIMHVDLNSCFATVKQQAFKHLRGKPLLVSAYNSPKGCVVAPSIEAKQYGVKVGIRVFEAKLMAPDAVVCTPDTALIRDVHIKLKKICSDYSPHVYPKSIDEVVVDFSNMEYFLKGRSLFDIGRVIKSRLKKDVGEWMKCSVGVGPNRFIAKVASSYHKPDGLTVIDHNNLLKIYSTMELTDLPYIKYKNQARLKQVGIFSIKDFLGAPLEVLTKQVFESINGYYWYKRIRGWEVDDIEFERKSFGQDYALQKATDNPKELSQILMKLCEKMGRRIRKYGHDAYGIHVSCVYKDNTWWHKGKIFHTSCSTTLELFRRAQYILDLQPYAKIIAKLGVSSYKLTPSGNTQASLFDDVDKKKQLSLALDKINDKYGEFVITPARMMGMDKEIVDRIAFGGVKEIESLYE
jgi:DNA polymerase-4